MDVFKVHELVIAEYRAFTSGFVEIRGRRIAAFGMSDRLSRPKQKSAGAGRMRAGSGFVFGPLGLLAAHPTNRSKIEMNERTFKDGEADLAACPDGGLVVAL